MGPSIFTTVMLTLALVIPCSDVLALPISPSISARGWQYLPNIQLMQFGNAGVAGFAGYYSRSASHPTPTAHKPTPSKPHTILVRQYSGDEAHGAQNFEDGHSLKSGSGSRPVLLGRRWDINPYTVQSMLFGNGALEAWASLPAPPAPLPSEIVVRCLGSGSNACVATPSSTPPSRAGPAHVHPRQWDDSSYYLPWLHFDNAAYGPATACQPSTHIATQIPTVIQTQVGSGATSAPLQPQARSLVKSPSGWSGLDPTLLQELRFGDGGIKVASAVLALPSRTLKLAFTPLATSTTATTYDIGPTATLSVQF